jgi:hypothetical protein
MATTNQIDVCKAIEIPLNGIDSDLQIALLPVQRGIEAVYRKLDLPPGVQNVIVFTDVLIGRGDIAAAAKVIDFLHQRYPSLCFQWILMNHDQDSQGHPLSYLSSKNLLHIPETKHLFGVKSYLLFNRREIHTIDLVISGPVPLSYNRLSTSPSNFFYLVSDQPIKGPYIAFSEDDCTNDRSNNRYRDIEKAAAARGGYEEIHNDLFPSKVIGIQSEMGMVQMGLEKGKGMILDPERISAPLSQRFSCPTYLLQIKDQELRTTLLHAMHCNTSEVPNYERYSLNFGYAHYVGSRLLFIDAVAMHERKKNVVIVCNRIAVLKEHTLHAAKLYQYLLQQNRIELLKSKGYRKIIFIGEEEKFIHQLTDRGRVLTIIIRDSFYPSDMKFLQLASERLLATGDNTAVESWCARCQLYLYEMFEHKKNFLKQQCLLAKQFSENFANLLDLFANMNRSDLFFPPDKLAKVEACLSDCDLAEKTLEFCHHIVENCSFAGVFEGALKRALWHYHLPELSKVESSSLDPDFCSHLISFIRDKDKGDIKQLAVTTLNDLERRVQDHVEDYIRTNHPLSYSSMKIYLRRVGNVVLNLLKMLY